MMDQRLRGAGTQTIANASIVYASVQSYAYAPMIWLLCSGSSTLFNRRHFTTGLQAQQFHPQRQLFTPILFHQRGLDLHPAPEQPLLPRHPHALLIPVQVTYDKHRAIPSPVPHSNNALHHHIRERHLAPLGATSCCLLGYEYGLQLLQN